MHIQIFLIMVLVLIIWFLKNKINTKETYTNTEALNTITSIYANSANVLRVNNLDLLGNSKIGGNLNVSGNLIVTGEVSGYIPKGIKARYVQVGNDIKVDIDKQNYWAISEIIVLDNRGLNVALNKRPTTKKGQNLTDDSIPNDSTNNKIEFTTDGIIYNTYYRGSAGENLIEIDLTQEYNLRQINLWARGGSNSLAQTNRLNGTHITLLNSRREPVYTIHTGSWENIYNKVYLL